MVVARLWWFQICFDLSLSHDGYGFGGCCDGGFIGFCFDIVVCH